MITILAYTMIAIFMVAIMTRTLSALIALILVPFLFGLLGGFGHELPAMMIDGIKSIAPTAVLLLFAIMYFGLMIDVGLFDPIVRLVVKICHGDPVRVIVGTTILSAIISLDGDGSTTYMLCVSAMMPLHRRLGLHPLILPLAILMPNSIMNIMPWGGPTARVLASLHLEANQVFLPMLPSIVLATLGSVGICWYLGLKERKRIGTLKMPTGSTSEFRDEDYAERPEGVKVATGWRAAFNIVLTVLLMVFLVADVAPLVVLFIIAFALAITVNFPSVADQRLRISAHAPSVLAVVSVIFAAGVFTGILKGTGMTDALAQSIVWMIPEGHGNLLPLITALISAPFTFFLSNDAFYFGVVPVLAEAASKYGIAPEVIARASLIGQPVHQLSPLVAALYVLLGLSKVEMGDFQRFALKWTLVLTALMLFAALVTGAVTLS
ncbi:CitMHS family transporter [Agrobacterium larrymoorei]|uniref:Citrate:proton symporter n=1 Tax=Agrobacterium larrymoorei TaxID=160699 RepID=A0AAF0HFZ0_9HYPH|nr:citrate:proton symporter [Agrobacterium larrymoorei]WHA44001.1 citrate:proton symporter [Agrobacterium larrymoorei]